MFAFKNSLVALIGLILFAGILSLAPQNVSQVNGKNDKDDCGPRRFYLTATEDHLGNTALTACAEGFHMASFWEIRDPTNLRYDTALGVNNDDSGSGPPTNLFGFVRTGAVATAPGFPGRSNCLAWTNAGDLNFGTMVQLPPEWDDITLSRAHPWLVGLSFCNTPRRVWCVAD